LIRASFYLKIAPRDDLRMKCLPRLCSGCLLGISLAILLASFLQACGGGQSLTKSTAPPGKTAPPITVVDMKGIPADKAQMLTEFVAEAAGKRDIAIVQGAFGDGYRLDGSFTAKATGSGTVVGYQWKLADATGQLIHSFSGAELAGAASGDPWSAAAPDVLRRIAAGTADNLASRLSELGYAIRTGALLEPPQSFAAAITAPEPAFAHSAY
jgi:hypothetical protein